jgi:hypothetical protein
MNIEARKLSFIQEFLKVENEKVIIALENFFDLTKKELFEDEMKPMSLKQFNEEIDKSLEDEANGRIINVKDLETKVRKWS